MNRISAARETFGDEESVAEWVAGRLAGSRLLRVELTALTFGVSPRGSAPNERHTRRLAELVTELPAIIVHEPTMRVIDGVHRVQAARLRGDTAILAKLVQGADADLFALAVNLNSQHGLPLERGDRIAALKQILVSHAMWSDRRIATLTGMSATTVASYRRHSAADLAQPSVRIGRDGRTRPVLGAERRREAVRIMLDRPDATLREVAREAGIALSTAHDVRRRIRDGQDPVTPMAAADESRRSAEAAGELSPESVVAARSIPVAGATVTAYAWSSRATSRPVALSQSDLESAVVRLRNDPSVRMTDVGRALLRILDAERVALSVAADSLAQLPNHCVSTVAEIIATYAQAWGDLANRAAVPGQVG